jgi:hypothetical protein
MTGAVSTEIERLGDRPWIIAAGFMKPHDSFVAPKKYCDLYPEGTLRLHRPPADQTPAPPLAGPFYLEYLPRRRGSSPSRPTRIPQTPKPEPVTAQRMR